MAKITVGDLANRLVGHNEVASYTDLVILGGPGSGKSVITRSIIHNLHHKYSYKIRYFLKADLDRLLEGTFNLDRRDGDYIFVFDDMSYSFARYDIEYYNTMLKRLSVLRHLVTGRLIVIMIVNFSFISMQLMRTADFRIISSMSEHEREAYVRIIGGEHERLMNAFYERYGRYYKLALVNAMGRMQLMSYRMIKKCSRCERG